MGGVRVTITSCIPFQPLLTFSKSCCIDPEVDHGISIEGRPKPFDDQQRKGTAATGQRTPVAWLGNPFLLRLVETGWPWLVPGGKVPGRFQFVHLHLGETQYPKVFLL